MYSNGSTENQFTKNSKDHSKLKLERCKGHKLSGFHQVTRAQLSVFKAPENTNLRRRGKQVKFLKQCHFFVHPSF